MYPVLYFDLIISQITQFYVEIIYNIKEEIGDIKVLKEK
jgi:hypothetical protein